LAILPLKALHSARLAAFTPALALLAISLHALFLPRFASEKVYLPTSQLAQVQLAPYASSMLSTSLYLGNTDPDAKLLFRRYDTWSRPAPRSESFHSGM
jgi:hypothetical protein